MSVNDLDLERVVTIKAINCDDILRNRLYSFGIIAGSQICVTAKSLAKKTIEIKINQSKVALRYSEAINIKVG
ncbi:iron transporter [Aliarcobacter trophiarum LMG 25534]|uniref:Ferrous iron transport protein A n=1 Tax=Aliarcobacter trophiarum LMG 25534 TaxID=1032241 RepID=A0AAD0QJ97_9BACT|nr:FeoA domain-containing protein [Aliarcobacter trophiarum]AXK48715.1 ferrous iron transport protein A [Aliarcobacter trophiarum LMG 25534]RXI28290.1 iron transporter [Aliarcobacter trophiarum]RXJ91341.1 iron transporter [Aliarcobacter trophiarum LMG 25534]